MVINLPSIETHHKPQLSTPIAKIETELKKPNKIHEMGTHDLAPTDKKNPYVNEFVIIV